MAFPKRASAQPSSAPEPAASVASEPAAFAVCEPAASASVTGAPDGLGRDWWRLWWAGAVSTLGDGVQGVAMPLLAASLTGSPGAVALVAAAGTLPGLLLSLWAGVLADRLDRRRLMIASQVVQAAGVVLIALLVAAGLRSVWLISLPAFVLGSAEAVFRAGAGAFLPTVVAPQGLDRANALQQSTETATALFAGPLLGAFAFGLAPQLPFWLDAVSFLASLALLAGIRVRPIPGSTTAATAPRAAATAPRTAVRADLAELATGVRWLAAHRLLRSITLAAGLQNLGFAMVMATLVLYVERVLRLPSGWLSWLYVALAAGGVLGGAVSPRLVERIGARNCALTVRAVTPVVFLAVAVLGRQLPVILVGMALAGFAAMPWNVATITVRQRLVPDELLGRVGGAHRTVIAGTIPLGALAGGLVATSFGLAAPWICAAAANLLALLVHARPALRDWQPGTGS